MVAARLSEFCGASVLGALCGCAGAWAVVYMGPVAAFAKTTQFAERSGIVGDKQGTEPRSVGFKGGRFWRPVVSEFSVDVDGYVRVSGLCAPMRAVHIRLDGQLHRTVACDGLGRFASKSLIALQSGEHVVSTFVRVDGNRERLGNDVRVFIPSEFSSFARAARPSSSYSSEIEVDDSDPNDIPEDVLDYSEELAHAASERFSELTRPDGGSDVRRFGDKRGGLNKLAQLDDDGVGRAREDGSDVTTTKDDLIDLPWPFEYAADAELRVKEWWRYSRETYLKDLVPQFRKQDGESPSEVVALGDAPLPERPNQVWGFEGVRVDLSKYVETSRSWLQTSASDYWTKIVRPLSLPAGVEVDAQVARAPDSTSNVISRTVQKRERFVVAVPKRSSVKKSVARVSPPPGRFVEDAKPAVELPSTEHASILTEPSASSSVVEDVKRVPSVEGRYVTAVPSVHASIEAQGSGPRDNDKTSDPSLDSDKKRKVVREGDLSLDDDVVTANDVAKARVKDTDEVPAEVEQGQKPPLPEKRERVSRRFSASSLTNSNMLPNRNPRRARVIALAPHVGVLKVEPSKHLEIRPVARGAVALGSILPPAKPEEYRIAHLQDIDHDGMELPPRRDKFLGSRFGAGAVAQGASNKSEAISRKTKRRGIAVRSYQKRRKAKRKTRFCGSRKSRIHRVRKGDTLWDIARRYYGNGSCYKRIARANRRKVPNPHRIYPRQRLVVPRLKRRN